MEDMDLMLPALYADPTHGHYPFDRTGDRCTVDFTVDKAFGNCREI